MKKNIFRACRHQFNDKCMWLTKTKGSKQKKICQGSDDRIERGEFLVATLGCNELFTP